MKLPMKTLASSVLCTSLLACSEGTHEGIDLSTTAEVASGEPWFRDVTAESGADFTHIRAHTHQIGRAHV